MQTHATTQQENILIVLTAHFLVCLTIMFLLIGG